jgi:tight adherence protein B
VRRRAVGIAAALCALAVAAPAAASVELTGIDTSAFPTIRATVVSSSGARPAPALTENGRPVVGLREENLGRAKAVVLAVDDSKSMKGAPLLAATNAARGFVAAKPARDAIAVLSFGPRPIALSSLTTSTIDADTALRGLRVAGRPGTALYDAIEVASRELAASPLPSRVLIVLTDGRDISSSATLEQAVAAAHAADVAVYPIGMEGQGFDPGALKRIAASTGGRYYGAASAAALGRIYSAIANRLAHTWHVAYVTAARPGDRLRLEASVAGAGTASAGTVVAAQPGDVTANPAPSVFLPAGAYGGAGPAVVGALVGALAVLAVLLLLGSRRGSWLRRRLAPHIGGARRTKRRRQSQLATFAGLIRATENAFGHLRQWKSVQTMLDRGQTPLRAAELFYITAGTAILFGLLAAVTGTTPVLILVAMALGACIPYGVAWYRMRRRLRAFEDQLPDILITVAASLKAGHSFKQGLQTVVDEGHPPASDEFKRVLTEAGLGRPIDEALNDMAERLGSANFEFAITAVTIQRQVGGALANLFDMVADTVRQRQQFARKIRSLTAMGRMSAYTLVGLPFFLVFAISFLNKGYLAPLLHSSAGHMMIALGLSMMAVGAAVLRKIVSFRG